MAGTGDPYDLGRFQQAQEDDYEQALSEITNGRKRIALDVVHLPAVRRTGFQLDRQALRDQEPRRGQGLPRSPGPRAEAAGVRGGGRPPRRPIRGEIFGSPDDLKLRSSATLFACVSPPGSVFERLLAKYYQGRRDDRTLQLLGTSPGIEATGRGSPRVVATSSFGIAHPASKCSPYESEHHRSGVSIFEDQHPSGPPRDADRRTGPAPPVARVLLEPVPRDPANPAPERLPRLIGPEWTEARDDRREDFLLAMWYHSRRPTDPEQAHPCTEGSIAEQDARSHTAVLRLASFARFSRRASWPVASFARFRGRTEGSVASFARFHPFQTPDSAAILADGFVFSVHNRAEPSRMGRSARKGPLHNASLNVMQDKKSIGRIRQCVQTHISGTVRTKRLDSFPCLQSSEILCNVLAGPNARQIPSTELPMTRYLIRRRRVANDSVIFPELGRSPGSRAGSRCNPHPAAAIRRNSEETAAGPGGRRIGPGGPAIGRRPRRAGRATGGSPAQSVAQGDSAWAAGESAINMVMRRTSPCPCAIISLLRSPIEGGGNPSTRAGRR